METYHLAWLTMHPNRNEEWLQEKLKEGFDVHHIDGNHGNNEPTNLVLIEHLDHMRLHGSVMGKGRMGFVSKKGKRKPRRTVELPDGRVIPLLSQERACHVLAAYRKEPNALAWDIRSGIKPVEKVVKESKPVLSPVTEEKLRYRDMWLAAAKA